MSLYVKPPEKENSEESAYLPVACRIEQVVRLTERERLFTVVVPEKLDFSPGQFFMVGVPGYGEAPISISAGDGERFELCVRAVGNVTNAVHALKKDGPLWMRGPFGRGFDVEGMKGKDIVFISGGIGIVPMRSLIKAVLADRDSFGKLTLLYGAREPVEILFNEEQPSWKDQGVDVRLTIDKPHADWKGGVGVITTLIPGVEMPPGKTIAVVIGPPVMYKFVALALKEKNVLPKDILLSLERRMKCGLGKCGHCQINHIYSCQDGPVFRLSELEGLCEAF